MAYCPKLGVASPSVLLIVVPEAAKVTPAAPSDSTANADVPAVHPVLSKVIVVSAALELVNR